MKKTIKPYPLIHPTTIVVVGTMYQNQPNFTTLGDIAVAGLNPPLIMASFHKNHQSTIFIEKHKRFTVNTTTSEMMKKVDFCGIHSASEIDKSNVFESILINGVPIMKESPISLIVSVIDRVQVEQRVIYICSVEQTMIEDDLVSENGLKLEGLKPLLYGLDNSYYSNISKIGTGYKEGK